MVGLSRARTPKKALASTCTGQARFAPHRNSPDLSRANGIGRLRRGAGSAGAGAGTGTQGHRHARHLRHGRASPRYLLARLLLGFQAAGSWVVDSFLDGWI
jgi:hypothetical protein